MSRYLCIQTGARRAYAVPRLLAEAGRLDRFHTDLAGNVGWGRILSRLPGSGGMAARLHGRQVPDRVLPLTTTHDEAALRLLVKDVFGRRDPETRFRRQIAFSRDFGRSLLRHGFGDATHLYSMLNEGSGLFEEARMRGIRVVSEVYILLSTERILSEEQRRFPDWEPSPLDYASLREELLPDDPYPGNIDLCLCPSEAVREDLIAHWGVLPERTALVPYGMDPRWLELETRPEPGRILFVGTADLRKGIHYLAFASELLRSRGFRGEFRIAGNVSETVRHHPDCRHLTFLGRIPRDRIHEEFQRADLFVLPSLAEGSAEVTYEALAAGVPQIVTRAAGSVARDGIDGLLVPKRDPQALADAIERGVGDRTWRAAASAASRERAREFTWERYGERMIASLKGPSSKL